MAQVRFHRVDPFHRVDSSPKRLRVEHGDELEHRFLQEQGMDAPAEPPRDGTVQQPAPETVPHQRIGDDAAYRHAVPGQELHVLFDGIFLHLGMGDAYLQIQVRYPDQVAQSRCPHDHLPGLLLPVQEVQGADGNRHTDVKHQGGSLQLFRLFHPSLLLCLLRRYDAVTFLAFLQRLQALYGAVEA